MRRSCVLLFVLALAVAVSAGEWHIETVDSEHDGLYNSLALDSSGYPHIAYYTYFYDFKLNYASWDGDEWHIETVDADGDMGWACMMVLDSHDYPHIVYCDYANPYLRYAHWDGESWRTETVSTNTSSGSLAVDGSDNPHIAYQDTDGYVLKYMSWDGDEWVTETVDSEGHVGGGQSLVLDSSDCPHISYVDSTNNGLKYARWDGDEWLTETVDTLEYNPGGSSLALDSDGHPHISYTDYIITYPTYNLKYARWDGNDWHVEMVDTPGAGLYSSLALDSSGHPHITYHHHVGYSLKYSHWDGDQWLIETIVDNGGRSSLLLDFLGYPHLSFSGECLQYAWWNEPPPAFGLLAPSDGETVHEWPLADWEDTVDYPDVTYDLWYSTDPDFNPHDEVTGLAQSEYRFSDAELDRDATYYWKVRAWDGYDETWSDETWSFYVAHDAGVESVDLDAAALDDGVLVGWAIVGDAPAALRVLRSAGESEPVAIHDNPLPGTATHYLDRVDKGLQPLAGVEYRYWLDVVAEDGTVSRFGPTEAVSFPGASRELELAVYPSPASSSFTVEYTLPEDGRISISLYDLSGRRVATVYDGETAAGRHAFSCDAAALTPGVYLVSLTTDAGSLTRRVVIAR